MLAVPFISSEASDSTDSTGLATHRKRTNSLSAFEMDSYIKGYHDKYKDIWTPTMEQALKAVPEPKNEVEKTSSLHNVWWWNCWTFEEGCNWMLYKDSLLPFTEEKGSCTAIVKGNAVNVADGKGMQVPCTLHFEGAQQNLFMYCNNSFRKTIK